MIKVLFVCHGNICRSPMAEFVFKSMVREAGLSDQFVIASAATSMVSGIRFIRLQGRSWKSMGFPARESGRAS